MNARSTNGASNVEPVVDQNAARGGRDSKGFVSQFSEFATGQLFLANLNPVNSRSGSCFHFLKKKRTRSDGRRGQSTFVRHVA
jgi:hypothetical protein